MGQDPHAGTATMIRSHGHPTVAPLHDDEVAVSAVIGTIMILAITVIGIAGVLYYGAPTIDRIQSRNAQVAMEGSFETLRASVQELSVPDHARYPSINLPSGILGLEPGDRFLITADHDSAFSSCDLHVTDWSDAGADKAVADNHDDGEHGARQHRHLGLPRLGHGLHIPAGRRNRLP